MNPLNHRDYHIEVNVMAPVTDDTRSEMMQAWGEGFEELGIPFMPLLARCQTFHAGQQAEFQQILYGVSGSVAPSAQAICDGMKESLANHGWPGVPVGVNIFVVNREMVDSTLNAEQATEQPFRKGVLAA